MSNCFLVKFPPNWSRAEREDLTERVSMQCFMPIPTSDPENEAVFLLYEDNQTVESFRERFDIPAACEIIESPLLPR